MSVTHHAFLDLVAHIHKKIKLCARNYVIRELVNITHKLLSRNMWPIRNNTLEPQEQLTRLQCILLTSSCQLGKKFVVSMMPSHGDFTLVILVHIKLPRVTAHFGWDYSTSVCMLQNWHRAPPPQKHTENMSNVVAASGSLNCSLFQMQHAFGTGCQHWLAG